MGSNNSSAFVFGPPLGDGEVFHQNPGLAARRETNRTHEDLTHSRTMYYTMYYMCIPYARKSMRRPTSPNHLLYHTYAHHRTHTVIDSRYNDTLHQRASRVSSQRIFRLFIFSHYRACPAALQHLQKCQYHLLGSVEMNIPLFFLPPNPKRFSKHTAVSRQTKKHARPIPPS